MPLKDAELTRSDVDIIEETTLYSGFFTMLGYRLRHRLFAGGWSEIITRELVHRGEASAAILYDPKHHLVGLVEQFRVGALHSEYGPWCLEVVAGMVEEGEAVDALIRREIVEEAGIEHAELLPITSYYSTPGGCGEKIHLFCALCDLSNAGGIYGLDEEGEDIRFCVLEPEVVFTDMLQGRTNNAATLIGLQWLQLNMTDLRARDAG